LKFGDLKQEEFENGNRLLKCWPSEFRYRNFFSKTSVFSKPMWNQWLWTLGGRKLSSPTGFFVWN